jgi:hypothetical protein
MTHLEKIIIVPLRDIVDNIYKLLTHAPGLRSTAFCVGLIRNRNFTSMLIGRSLLN